jgi:hypothetical protein
MKNWTDFHIGIVYFAGLFIALASGILIILYLRPVKSIINKIEKRFDRLWTGNFKSTTILAGLLGAMSVSFRDCDGNYDYLLKSKEQTILKGLEQVSVSFEYLAFVLGLWLVIFMILRMTGNRNKQQNP